MNFRTPHVTRADPSGPSGPSDPSGSSNLSVLSGPGVTTPRTPSSTPVPTSVPVPAHSTHRAIRVLRSPR